MSLTESQLSADLTAAMKARDRVRTDVLRGLVAAAKMVKVEKRGAALNDEELIQIVRREVRKRDEASEFARKAGREDLVAQNEAERALLEGYLPATPTGAVLEAKVREILAATPSPDMGRVMRGLKDAFGTALDGREASEVVRRLLAQAAGGV